MQLSPRVFRYSLDWRFLLPMGKAEAVYFLLAEDEEFSQALKQVGMNGTQRLSLSDLGQTKAKEIQSLVIPFGLPTSWVNAKHEDQVEFYSSAQRLISSGGYLLVGFNNIWNVRGSSQIKYYASTPRRVAAQLKQAGFSYVKMFGAMPNLAIPEYIFDLDSRAIQFALHNRFRRKPAVFHALNSLAETVGFARLSNFLPCYFVVAVV
jgi:hypothetical protein